MNAVRTTTFASFIKPIQQMNSRIARLGLIGLSNFGQTHAHTLTRLHDCQLVTVVDSDSQRLDWAAEHLREVPAYGVLNEALGNVQMVGSSPHRRPAILCWRVRFWPQGVAC